MESEMNLEEIPYEKAIQGNQQLRQPTPKGKDWDEVMAYLKQGKYDKVIEIHNNRYKKQIIKSRIKRYMPVTLLKLVRLIMK